MTFRNIAQVTPDDNDPPWFKKKKKFLHIKCLSTVVGYFKSAASNRFARSSTKVEKITLFGK